MSNFAHAGDDHPEAAAKHLDDASTLLAVKHYDGAGYLAGYVIECSLKSLVIADEISKLGSAGLVSGWNKGRKLKHDLGGLSRAGLALASLPGSSTAPYAPQPTVESIYHHGWTESLRYAAPGAVGPATAARWVAEARTIYQCTVAKMRQDGVIQ